jgi:hypothetical protein
MLVDERTRQRNEKLDVRVVDVLERKDGDHKLLALPLDAEPQSPATLRRLAQLRPRIMQYYVDLEKPVTRWGGESAAIEIIKACRGATRGMA